LPDIMSNQERPNSMTDEFAGLRLAISEQLSKDGKDDDEIYVAYMNEVELRKKLKSHYIEINELNRKYRKDANSIQKSICEIRKECKHYEIKYYSDPSGNNDSGYVCQLCGKDRHKASDFGGIWAKKE
jgi:hypothetical protein